MRESSQLSKHQMHLTLLTRLRTPAGDKAITCRCSGIYGAKRLNRRLTRLGLGGAGEEASGGGGDNGSLSLTEPNFYCC